MSFYITNEKMNRIIKDLEKEYRIFAPRRFKKRGWRPDMDLIRYAEINSVEEIVHNEKSDFSPKEVFFPIIQTLFFFTGSECSVSAADDKKIILFARPCDINGLRRLDEIFLKNGQNEDFFYKRLRDKLKIFMIECRNSWDNCFCVSMNSNSTNDYSLAARFEADHLLAEVKDAEFQKYFSTEPVTEFIPEFVRSNTKTVRLPRICDSDDLKKAHELKMWRDINDKCLSCGACSAVCVTCGCFDTTDIIYDETSPDGERRRVWASCMNEDFTLMAGGHSVRKTGGERMRFRTLHKIHDYRKRFGEENMCVGCGRCDGRCPTEISFSNTINALSDALENEESITEVAL